MKTYSLLKIVVCFTFAILCMPFDSHAVPVGSRNEGIKYLFKGRSLDWLSAGIYQHAINRDVEVKTGWLQGTTQPWKTERTTGYIGISALSWMNIYGVFGQNKTKFARRERTGGSSVYGAGARFNLLDHHITEPATISDRWRLTAGVEYLITKTEVWPRETWEWNEINAALTLSIVNDLDRNKLFTAESISLYAGPMYSMIDSDSFNEKNAFGALIGGELFFTDSISLDVRAVIYSDVGFSAGINVHF